MTKTNEYESIIDAWMVSIIKNDGLERYDDLHVDQIDSRWKSPDVWIEAGLACFQIAINLRNRHEFRCTLALVFSLCELTDSEQASFTNAMELRRQLDWSPPSLYLFPAGREPWIEPNAADMSVQAFDASNILGLPMVVSGYLLSFRAAESNQYFRTFLLASQKNGDTKAPEDRAR